ncbi:Golgi integral membrane protein 4-like [Panicum virgatum]|uniref:Golgi integral membrane protein 4-like n=1 Tax=Panicum virgatum TaxID=38727 RepID=UPI0019D6632C|nr:Golgi integral membrane protein 4-like [Panicum virgatum]
MDNIDEVTDKRMKALKEIEKDKLRVARAYNKKIKDLDTVEWHYLVKFFGTPEFQARSARNTQNRLLRKTQHLAGSKPFSQLSYEKRDPETGEELNDLDLWLMTHTKDGSWTNQTSKDIYDTASAKISERESNASYGNIVRNVERNLIFQKAYQEVTTSKKKRLHGNGYMDVYPTRRQLLLKDFNNRSMTEQQIHEENLAIEESLGKLHNHMARRDAEQLEEMATFMQEFEAQKEEHRLAMEALQEEHRKELEELRKAREADKEALKKELLSMMKEAQGNEALHQPNNDGNNGTTQGSGATHITQQDEEQTNTDAPPLPQMVSSEKAIVSEVNIIKATMEELADDERQAYLITEEHLKEQFLHGFKECAVLQVERRQG